MRKQPGILLQALVSRVHRTLSVSSKNILDRGSYLQLIQTQLPPGQRRAREGTIGFGHHRHHQTRFKTKPRTGKKVPGTDLSVNQQFHSFKYLKQKPK